MRIPAILSVTALLFSAMAGEAGAQVLIDTHGKSAPGGFTLSPVLSYSEIEYDTDNVGKGDVERTIIGLAGAYGINRAVDVYAELGYIAEAELEGSRDDDDGILVGAGVRGLFYQERQVSIHGRAGFRFISEDYGSGVDGDVAEIETGVIARYAVTDNFGAYGGLDLVLFSDGEIDAQGFDDDVERDDILGLRFGADFALHPLVINAELGLISEETFTLRLTFPL